MEQIEMTIMSQNIFCVTFMTEVPLQRNIDF